VEELNAEWPKPPPPDTRRKQLDAGFAPSEAGTKPKLQKQQFRRNMTLS